MYRNRPAIRAQIIRQHQDAMAGDEELAADIESDLNEALWDFPREGEAVFGAKAAKGAKKLAKLAKRLGKLTARLEKIESKPEPRGLFAKLRSNLRDKRISRLEKRIDKIRSKIEARGGSADPDADIMGAWPPIGHIPQGAHPGTPRFQTIGQSAAMSNAALIAALNQPGVSVRSKARIRQVLAERGIVPGGGFMVQSQRDTRDRMLHRFPHQRLRAPRMLRRGGRRWRCR